MTRRVFERFYGRRVELDSCRPCQAFWFDDQELLQLTPGATLEVLTVLQGVEGAPRRPVAEHGPCPRCGEKLAEVHDRQRGTRFTYGRCPAGHGRFLDYYQFLRAKDFVRELNPREIAELRESIRQVHCSNCGAPVDVVAGARCASCRSPLAILDPKQIDKIVAQLQRGEEQRAPGKVDPLLPMRLALERSRAERTWAEIPGHQDWKELLGSPVAASGAGADLIALGLAAVARWLED
jgi:hypothetical protein